MNKKLFIRLKVLFVFLTFLKMPIVSGQNFEDLLDSYIDNNAKGYLQPLGELVSANINTGIRDWSRVDSHIHVKIGINTMFSFPSSKMKTFSGLTGLGFEPQQNATIPTIIGSNKPVAVEGVNGTYFVFPVGYNSRFIPFAVPQITIGGMYNTELTGRYFGFQLSNDFGNIEFLGFGLRHGLNQYFKNLKFDLSAGYMFQKFKVGSYLLNQNHFISAHIGKCAKWWSSQLTLGYLYSTTDYNFSYKDEDISKTFHQTINSRFPILVELSGSIKIWVISVYSAVSYSGPITVSGGIIFKI